MTVTKIWYILFLDEELRTSNSIYIIASRKRDIMKKHKWLVGTTVLALSLGLGACSSGDTEKASGDKAQVEEKDTTKKEEPVKELNRDAKFDKEKDKAAHNITTKKIGETIKVDNLNVTVSSPKVVPDSELSKNKNGQFISVNITIENAGKKSEKISELVHFGVEKGDTQYFATVVSGATENHINGDVPAGEKKEGIATFDVPKDGDLKFTFNGFSKSKGVWTFTQDDIQQAQ